MTGNQLDLIEYDGAPASNRTTSLEAAKEMVESGRGTWRQAQVYHTLNYFGSQTDYDIWFQLQNPYGVPSILMSSVVSTRNTLVRRGLVRNSGRTRKSPTTGRNAIVWEVVR